MHLPVCEHVRSKIILVCDMFEGSYPCITLILTQCYRGGREGREGHTAIATPQLYKAGFQDSVIIMKSNIWE